MADPFGFGAVPPEIRALMARGQYSQAFRESGKVVAREVVRKGSRIVQPIARVGSTFLRAGGYMAESEGLLAAGGAVEISEGAAVLYASEQLAVGWGSLLAAGTVVAEAIPPVACFCLLVGIAWLLSHGEINSRQAPIARQQLRQELGVARKSQCFCARGTVQTGFRSGAQIAFQQMPMPSNCSFPACQMRGAS